MKTPKKFNYLFIGCVLFLSSFSAFAKWPIKKFKVEVESPWRIGPELRNELEQYLSEVSHEFEKMGFNPPILETIKLDDGEIAYKINVVVTINPLAKKKASYDVRCHLLPKGGKITFDRSLLIGNNENGIEIIKNKGYQDLTHELFHAVQANYELFYYNCHLGDWIGEGTAQAVGLDIAKKLRGIPIETCDIGSRPYDEILYIPDESTRKGRENCDGRQAYYTESLWRYLGEEAYFKNIRYSSAKSKPFTKFPKYEYLVKFFDSNVSKASEADEYKWLNYNLKEYFGYGLDRMYPKFVGVIAGYWPERLKIPGVTASPTPDNWFKFIFGGCEVVSVSKSKTTEFQVDSIAPIASKCLQFKFDFTGQANFTIIAEATNQQLLDLAISVPGAEKRLQPIVYPSKESPEKVSFKYSEPVEENAPKYFIVSNVANKPYKTKKQAPKFKVVFNTAAANIKDPKTKSPAETGEATQTPDSGKKLAKAQLEQGFETESWFTQAQRVDRAPCEKAFIDRICGPQTRISMDIGPDTLAILHEAVQPTMSFERLANVMGGVDEIGGENVTESLIEVHQNIGSEDGAGIGIVIPQIEYGFTGSFDNALISVSKALDEVGKSTGSYRSIGPERVGDCGSDGYYPYSGKVTIEEASHQVLRGSYSANLVDTSATTSECGPLPIAKYISGTFSLPNPRIGKDEPEGVLSEDIVDHTIQQINELMPGMYTGELGEKAREVAAQKLREKEARKAARQQESETASTDLVCECKCETATDMLDNNPDCFRQCLPTYQSCEDIDQIVSQSESNRPPTEQENEQIAKLRTEFEVLIQKQFPTQQMQQMMLIGFDDLPNLKAKQQLVDQFKGKQ